VPTLARSLRRLSAAKLGTALRGEGALPALEAAAIRSRPKLLLDTTVYVDVLRGRVAPLLEAALGASDLWHSAVAVAELARGLGADDPKRRGYREDARLTTKFVDRMPAHKIVVPDIEIYELAGIASSVMARLLGLDRSRMARHTNDALLFFSARKHGLTLLTRNRRDFAILRQLDPRTAVFGY
jgi:predicted nucleic acid-binding protein